MTATATKTERSTKDTVVSRSNRSTTEARPPRAKIHSGSRRRVRFGREQLGVNHHGKCRHHSSRRLLDDETRQLCSGRSHQRKLRATSLCRSKLHSVHRARASVTEASSSPSVRCCGVTDGTSEDGDQCRRCSLHVCYYVVWYSIHIQKLGASSFSWKPRQSHPCPPWTRR